MRRFFQYCALSTLTVSSLCAYEGQLKNGDRILITSHQPDALLTMNPDGELLWQSEIVLKHPQQVVAMPNGRVLCARIDGATMFDADSTVAWSYQVPEGAENATAVYLEEGRYLVAHEGLSELVELNEAGEVTSTTQVPVINTKVHGQFRYLGYGDGNYLVPMTNSATFREVQPETGKVLWELTDLKQVTSALRCEDGGTYICSRDRIARYDAARELEWSVSFTQDCGFAKSVPPTGMVPLPDGNLLIAFWHAHTDVPEMIEFDPVAKQLVHQWDVPGVQRIGCVAHLPEGHAFQNTSIR